MVSIIRQSRMHELRLFATDDPVVCLSVCHEGFSRLWRLRLCLVMGLGFDINVYVRITPVAERGVTA